MQLENFSLALTSILLLLDSLAVVWYWRHYDRHLTALGAALPRLYLCAAYMAILIVPIGLADRPLLVRSGLMWLAAAELVHLFVLFFERKALRRP